MNSTFQNALYPLVCTLSLLLLPYQPEHDPRLISGDLLDSAPVMSCPVPRA